MPHGSKVSTSLLGVLQRASAYPAISVIPVSDPTYRWSKVLWRPMPYKLTFLSEWWGTFETFGRVCYSDGERTKTSQLFDHFLLLPFPCYFVDFVHDFCISCAHAWMRYQPCLCMCFLRWASPRECSEGSNTSIFRSRALLCTFRMIHIVGWKWWRSRVQITLATEEHNFLIATIDFWQQGETGSGCTCQTLWDAKLIQQRRMVINWVARSNDDLYMSAQSFQYSDLKEY